MKDMSFPCGFSILLLIFIVLAVPAASAEYYVHRDYDWEGDDVNEQDPPAGAESCFVCHLGGMFPPPGAKRKVCEDCHTINETLGHPNGPYAAHDTSGDGDTDDPKDYNLRSDYNQSVPIVYKHFYIYGGPACFSFDSDTGGGICHGVAYSYRENAGGYFSFNESRIKSRDNPYLYTVSSTFLPNSTNCLFCHNQTNEGVRNAWGNAPQTLLHYNSTMNEDCYRCHVEGAKTPASFHSRELFLKSPEKASLLGKGIVILIVGLIISMVGIRFIKRKRG